MRHSWSKEPRTDFEKTERDCLRPGCPIVRVTRHPPHGYPWREFTRDKQTIAGPDDPTPPCEGRLQ